MTADVKLLADELESIATEELKDYPGAARIVRNAAKLLTRHGEALERHAASTQGTSGAPSKCSAKRRDRWVLDTTHNCWYGAYSAFMRWRKEVARAAGLPPLELMEGFFAPQGNGAMIPTFYLGMQRDKVMENFINDIERRLPISWDCLKPSALHELLYHSDCEGNIPAIRCGPIADALEEILPNMPTGDGGGRIGNWRAKTQQFIDGLRAAAAASEAVEFH